MIPTATPGFADSFWSPDYGAGLGVLFGKLQQGVLETRQVLTITRMRAEAEEVYAQRMADIPTTVDKVQGGFSRDDGASVRKAYDGMRAEMEVASRNHRKIAQSIRDLVVTPFSRWCDAHETRVQDSQDELQSRIKVHDKQAELVKKLRAAYFGKCRLLEDLEEENKLAFRDPETSPRQGGIPAIKVEAHNEEVDEDEPYEIGDDTFSAEQVKKVIAHMLANIPTGETKVPILGTYLNTSSGADIVDYLQRHMGSSSVSYAERVGQDLITHGFLRLVGNVGNTFANTSRMFYQWRPKAFKMSGMPEKKPPLGRTFTLPSDADSPVVGAVSEYLAGWNVINTSRPGETPAARLRREAREADDRYKAAVRKLDDMRCGLEEAIFVHLKFLERCELDRLKAIKTVILDFSGTISNVIPSLQSTVDNMMLFQETVQPLGDLRYLLESYRTGGFAPKVVVYQNYYDRIDQQTFGVELEQRARADKKRVPFIVTTVLTYLDNHYPDLEGDEARRGVWLAEVPLAHTHKLRNKINNSGEPPDASVFSEFDLATVASLLRLYLLELPESLVSFHVYEIIRTIYTTTDAADSAARVPILQQTLAQLRLTHIATLDACMNHFTRLIDLTSADDEYVSKLATSLAPCILRPRTETSLTLEEKHAYRLVRDLLAHKDAIFDELKRLSTLGLNGGPGAMPTGHANGNHRPHVISTDESNRRAHVEERNRALFEKAGGGSSRSRATSPAPSPRGHRRDRSVGAPDTRFPIQVSPTTAHRQSLGPVLPKRTSLEVPGDVSLGSPPGDGGAGNADDAALATNAAAVTANAAALRALGDVDGVVGSAVEKRNSLGRSGARMSGGRRVGGTGGLEAHRVSMGSMHGVTLTDAPMDD